MGSNWSSDVRTRTLLWGGVAVLLAMYFGGQSGIVWHWLPDHTREFVSYRLIANWRSFAGEGGVLSFFCLYALLLAGGLARRLQRPPVAGSHSIVTLFAARCHLAEVMIVALLGYAMYQALDDSLLFATRMIESVAAGAFDWAQLGRSAAIAAWHVALLICAAHVVLGLGDGRLARAAAVILIPIAIGIPAQNTWILYGYSPNNFLPRVFDLMGSAFVTSALEIWLALLVLRGRADRYAPLLQLRGASMRRLVPVVLSGIGVIIAIQVALSCLAKLPRQAEALDIRMLAVNATWLAGAMIALAISIKGTWQAITSARENASSPILVAQHGLSLHAYRTAVLSIFAIAVAALGYFLFSLSAALLNLSSLSSRGLDNFVGGLLWGFVLALLVPGVIFCSATMFFGWREIRALRAEFAPASEKP